MKKQGALRKMKTEWKDPVNYFLPLGDDEIAMNELLNREVGLRFLGEIHCIRCGRLTRKSFHQGYCFPCYRTAPETDDCILKPELCRAQEGISRDMEWSKEHCLQDHYVYLAVSSGLKVGVTRHTQIPARWIDQGASFAIKIAKTPNRHLAGLLEVDLKKHFADKTNWRNMLTDKIDTGIDLLEQKEKAREFIKKEYAQYFINDHEIVDIHYPVTTYPSKVNSFTFDKEEQITGQLTGIKGQYLIFDGGRVLNIRKHNGYEVELTIN
ncbi:MAG: DUF2797 domain-containing protein [Bacteroidales bacterium]|jgi:hypothetical protein|nr:DUF2797 domain-containing protein [Bacteroidales bacterium]